MGAIAAVCAGALALPASAAPLTLSAPASIDLAPSHLIQAGGNGHYGSREYHRGSHIRRGGIYPRGIHVRRGHHYYNGYRGYRQFRHGYRKHKGYWFPVAAFALKVIIENERQRSNYRHVAKPKIIHHNSQHVAWCQGRYKTYRVADNTYIPKVGYRAHCRSPYSR
jgi:hypothetical protein